MFIVMWLFFVLLNGRLTAEIALLGAAVSAAVFAAMGVALDWSIKRELRLYALLPRLVLYALKMVWEIFKANLATLRRVYGRRHVEPAIVTLRHGLKTHWQIQTLANSITLTPGTISVACDDETVVVHCLDGSFAEGLAEMAENVAKLEGK